MALTQKEKYKSLNLILEQDCPVFYELFRDTYGRKLKIGDYVRINTTWENKYIHQGVYLIDFNFEDGVRFVCQGIFKNEFIQVERDEWKELAREGNMFILKNVFTIKDFRPEKNNYLGRIRTTLDKKGDFAICSIAKLKNGCSRKIIPIWKC